MFTMFALFLFSTATAFAGIIAQESHACATGCARRYEVWSLYVDDCTGAVYTLLVTCDDLTYMNVPNPWCSINIPPGHNPFPTNFWNQIANANFVTPGGDCGYYLNNADGSKITFHNPANAEEAAKVYAAYECTFLGMIH